MLALISTYTTTHKLRSWRRLCAALIFTFMICGFVAQASAGPHLEVQVIKAMKNKSSKGDSSLKALSSALKKSFPDFKAFKLISNHSYKSEQNKTHTLQIRSKLKVLLKVDESTDGIRLTTTVKSKKTKRGTTKARYGELFFQAFKWRGNALILAVIARK